MSFTSEILKEFNVTINIHKSYSLADMKKILSEIYNEHKKKTKEKEKEQKRQQKEKEKEQKRQQKEDEERNHNFRENYKRRQENFYKNFAEFQKEAEGEQENEEEYRKFEEEYKKRQEHFNKNFKGFQNEKNSKYYKILGLQPNATQEEVKKAFKKIALSCHPDKLVNEPEGKLKEEKIQRFKAATDAYKILTS